MWQFNITPVLQKAFIPSPIILITVTAELIPGRLTDAYPKEYRYLDLVDSGRYDYRIEAVSTDGSVKRYGSRRTMALSVSA